MLEVHPACRFKGDEYAAKLPKTPKKYCSWLRLDWNMSVPLETKYYLSNGRARTLRYVQLTEALFQRDDDFICKAADTVKEAKTLTEAGFEYVCELNNIKLFRKRK